MSPDHRGKQGQGPELTYVPGIEVMHVTLETLPALTAPDPGRAPPPLPLPRARS